MKSCSGGGLAQFTLLALYDYYLATVISGASFGEDLQANLKAELRQIGQTHYTHFLQEQPTTLDILEFEFPKNNLNTRYLISDLDDLFKRWSNVDHFALDTLRTSKDFDYNFSLKLFFDAYENTYYEPLQFGHIGQSDWNDAVMRVKEELVQIGRNHFGGSAADIYNLNQIFSVKDEYFRPIIEDLIQLFSRKIVPFCEPHLVHQVIFKSINHFKTGHVYIYLKDAQISGLSTLGRWNGSFQGEVSSSFFRKGDRVTPIYLADDEINEICLKKTPAGHLTRDFSCVGFLNIDTGMVHKLIVDTIDYAMYPFAEEFDDLGPDMYVRQISFQGKVFAATTNLSDLKEFETYFKSVIEGVEGIEGWWDFIDRNIDEIAPHLTSRDFIRLIWRGYEVAEEVLIQLKSPYKKSPRYAWINREHEGPGAKEVRLKPQFDV